LLIIGIDVGGTFTDFFGVNRLSGDQYTFKVPSTPSDPSVAVSSGLIQFLEKYHLNPADVVRILHGTTVGTNAILENKGAKVGLITNSGFRDVLHIGRHQRPQHYSIGQEIPWQNRVLIDRKYRKTIDCRLDSDGNELVPVNKSQIYKHLDFFKSHDVSSILVAFLFSFRNNSHELEVYNIIREHIPEFFVTTSASVSPQFREFERFTTGAIAAYIGPKVAHYITKLSSDLSGICPNAELRIMTSSGGLATPEMIVRHPELTLLSGLVAGANAGAWLAEKRGIQNLITLDIGGTSADISIINGGQLNEVSSRNANIAGYPVQLPMVDIHTIGAGGGSIARVDTGGAFKVGPESAGAFPGPSCYNLGGIQPTVTDANLLLGYLSAERILDGRLMLDDQLAKTSFELIAEHLNSDVMSTALGTLTVLNNNMASAIRSRTVQKGIDTRDFTLCAFGGAGPLQAAGVADILGIKRVIIPSYPGIMCALGLLASKVEYHSVRTILLSKSQFSFETFKMSLDSMRDEISAIFKRDGIDGKSLSFQFVADLRYFGQGYELKIQIPEKISSASELLEIWDAFHAEHELEYGHSFKNADIELVSLKVKGSLFEEEFTLENSSKDTSSKLSLMPETSEKMVSYYQAGERIELMTKFKDREDLEPGVTYQGPWLIYQEDSTTVVPPGWEMRIEADSTIIMTRCERSDE